MRTICCNEKAHSPAAQMQAEAVRFLEGFSYFFRSPISFCSSVKKLSTSANCW